MLSWSCFRLTLHYEIDPIRMYWNTMMHPFQSSSWHKDHFTLSVSSIWSTAEKTLRPFGPANPQL